MSASWRSSRPCGRRWKRCGGLAGRRQGWGGLRNLIAHQYGSLNLELVAHALHEELGDRRDFATAMAGLATED